VSDPRSAIDLATVALGLDRLGLGLSIIADPTLVDPESFGATREDSDGRITVGLGLAAFEDSSTLLGTILHEAIGHAALGRSEVDPSFSEHWPLEELQALRIELLAAAVLGLPEARIERIQESVARRERDSGGLAPDPEGEAGTEPVQWVDRGSDEERRTPLRDR